MKWNKRGAGRIQEPLGGISKNTLRVKSSQASEFRNTTGVIQAEPTLARDGVDPKNPTTGHNPGLSHGCIDLCLHE